MKPKILRYALLIGVILLAVAATVLTINYILNEAAENTTSFQEEVTSSTEESTSDTEPHKHSFGEWSITKEATCTVDGEQERSSNVLQNEKIRDTI